MKSILTSTGSLMPLALGLASIVACGGSTLRVRGAQFDLNGQEAALAEQYTRGDPVEAPPEVRCQYWASRSMDAMRPHALGLLIWPPERFVTLRQWSEGKQMAVCRGHIKHEQQPDGADATARISNGTVVATFTAKAKCRDTLVDDHGHPFNQQPPWSPCPGSPLANASVRLIFADGQAVSDTTDKNGFVAFDLSEVRLNDGVLESGEAQVALSSAPALAVVPLTTLPQYAQWQKAKEAQRVDSEAERVQAEAQRQMDRMEGDLNQIEPVYTMLDHAKARLTDAEWAQVQAITPEFDDLGVAAQYFVHPPDASCAARWGPLHKRFDALVNRMTAQSPRVEREAAIRNR